MVFTADAHLASEIEYKTKQNQVLGRQQDKGEPEIAPLDKIVEHPDNQKEDRIEPGAPDCPQLDAHFHFIHFPH
jgi:hypothetical protein